jgi:arylsulfatase A-like enzyme
MTNTIKRRRVLVGLACIALLAVAIAIPSFLSADDAGGGEGGPNILIILTDDQRADMLPRDVTPNIVELFGDEGVHYANGIVTTPLCCPSRASIFSGKYVHNHGIEDNTPEDEDWDPDATIQKELKEEGYQTAIAGKFYSNWGGDPPHFDHWAIQVRPTVDERAYFDANFDVNGETQRVPIHSTDFTRFKALEMLDDLEEDDDTPWFLQVATLSPHRPFTPKPEHENADVGSYKPPVSIKENRRDKPPFVRKMRQYPAELAGQVHQKMLRGMIGVDELVRDVFTWLDAHGEADNTLAFFLSDNGFILGEHRIMLRKQLPYHPAVRVPFYARWPGELDEGSVDDRIVANIDLAPTIYDAIGLAADDIGYEPDGVSLLADEEREHILIESPLEDEKAPAWEGLWTPEWQYFRYSTGDREYYEDEAQLTNLLGNRSQTDDPDTGEWDTILDEAVECQGRACP